jgi:hypothetical protein
MLLEPESSAKWGAMSFNVLRFWASCFAFCAACQSAKDGIGEGGAASGGNGGEYSGNFDSTPEKGRPETDCGPMTLSNSSLMGAGFESIASASCGVTPDWTSS